MIQRIIKLLRGIVKPQGKGSPSEIIEWYNSNKYEMVLHKQTRKLIEEMMKVQEES